MSDPYLGEIRMFGGNYAPEGWAFCNGQLLNIQGNEALYSLIGVTYGGDGSTNFALPDLRGRLPIHKGQNPTTGTTYVMGQKAGTETVTLTEAQLPAHTHTAMGRTENGTQEGPANAIWAAPYDAAQQPPARPQYLPNTTANLQMNAANIAAAGGGQPHGNVMPYFPLSFIIALQGYYPTQN